MISSMNRGVVAWLSRFAISVAIFAMVGPVVAVVWGRRFVRVLNTGSF